MYDDTVKLYCFAGDIVRSVANIVVNVSSVRRGCSNETFDFYSDTESRKTFVLVSVGLFIDSFTVDVMHCFTGQKWQCDSEVIK